MIPVQISFVDLDKSDAVEEAVQKRVEKLEHFYDRIERCEVRIASPHKLTDRYFHVHIHLFIPGNDVIVSRDPEHNEDHRDVYLAVRDAFNTAERVLKQKVKQLRGFSKSKARRSATPDIRENF